MKAWWARQDREDARAVRIAAYVLAVLVFSVLVACCHGCTTWEASIEKPVDLTQPVEGVPLNFRAGVGGKF